MKEFTKDDIATALYDAFAYRLGPDVWEEAEQEFWNHLNATQPVNVANGVSYAVPDKCSECHGVFGVIETHTDNCSHRR